MDIFPTDANRGAARPRDGNGLVARVRDLLADGFAREAGAQVPAVLESLDHQLQAMQDRAKWRPLREGIALLEGLRPSFAERVAAHARERFDASMGSAAHADLASVSLDAMSLVADDAIQEEIELGHVVTRLADRAAEPVTALTRRMAWLLGVERFPDDHNPAQPRLLAGALLDTLHEAPQDAPARIAVLTSFCAELLGAVPALYQSVNEMLAANGILPDAKGEHAQPVLQQDRDAGVPPASGAKGGTAQAGPSPVQGAGGAAGAGHAPSLAGQLDQLFAAAEARQAAPAMPSVASGGVAAAPGMISVQIRPELLEALRALESRIPAEPSLAGLQHAAFPDAGEPGPRDPPSARQAREQLGEALAPVDGVVADIVVALFDRLLADPRLSAPILAPLGRLQLPVLKTVMQDRRVLADAEHPIRRAIDAFAELAAIDALSRVDHRTPGEWAQQAVDDFLAHESEPEAFAAFARGLAEVLGRFHEAALASDDTVRLVRAHEDHFVAVQDAAREVARRLATAACPGPVTEPLQRAWRDVLVHDHAQGGVDGTQWKSDLGTLDELLSSLAPLASREERAKMVATLPVLLGHVKESLARAGVNHDLAVRMLEELEHAHAELARSHSHAVTPPVPMAAANEGDTATPEPPAESPTAGDGLAAGSWLDFVEADSTRHRCRLTWTSARSGIGVFRDLARGKSFALSRSELAARRDAGTVLAVDGPGLAESVIEAAIADVTKSGASAGQVPA